MNELISPQVQEVEKRLILKANRLKRQGMAVTVLRRINQNPKEQPTPEFFLLMDTRPAQNMEMDTSRQVHIVVPEGGIAFIRHSVNGGGYAGPNWSAFCDFRSATRKIIGRHIANAAYGRDYRPLLQNSPQGFKVEEIKF